MIKKEISKVKFNQIYDKYNRLVMMIALSILGNRESAEDALQATFISVAQNLDKLGDDPVKTRNYISSTAHHKALKLLEKEKRIRDNEIPFPAENEEKDKNERKLRRHKELEIESFENEVLDKMEREEFLRCLEKLGTENAMIVKDYYCDELTFRQIADKYGLSEDTAKKRVYRSLEKLRKSFLRKE